MYNAGQFIIVGAIGVGVLLLFLYFFFSSSRKLAFSQRDSREDRNWEAISEGLRRENQLSRNAAQQARVDRPERSNSAADVVRRIASGFTPRRKKAVADAVERTFAAVEASPVSKSGESDRTCAVCLVDIEEGEARRRLQCGHAFHADCVLCWWTHKPRDSFQCPMCRQKQLLSFDLSFFPHDKKSIREAAVVSDGGASASTQAPSVPSRGQPRDGTASDELV